jgi:hypothetical protein
MKKVLKIFGAVILLLILLIVLLPIVFKGKIVEIVQQQMDENLNATISLEDIDLSLISSFPDFSLELNKLQITGKAPFEGVKLADIGSIRVKLDIMSVIKGEQMQIKTLGIENATFNVLVNKDTLANYDIVKTSGEADTAEAAVEDGEPAAFKIALQEYYLRNINLIYDDKPGDMYVDLKNLTHEGKGDFTQDVFMLLTQTNIEALTFKMDGMRYLKKAKFDIKFDTEIDMPNSKYTFKENHFGINNLMLHFDGYVALPDSETTELDLVFSTERTDFKSVLSLVPAVYMKDFESVKTAGNFALSGFAKGAMKGADLPSFNLDLKVDNAMFQYPDLPKAVNAIFIDLNVKNPGGSDDNTIVDLRKFHMELGTNPVDIRYFVKTPMSDPDMEGTVKADIDLATLNDILPSDAGEEYKGKILADINLKGKLSTIEQEDYENFDASGSMVLEGIAYSDSALGYPVMLHKADFRFSPKQIDMAELNCNLGKSDLSGSGYIARYLPYYFRDETVVARMSIASQLLDLNELAGTDADTASTATAETPADTSAAAEGEVAEVPANIDFELDSRFEKVLYDNMEMAEMVGKITIRSSKVSMDNLSMKMLGGNLRMNGYYETTNPKQPTVDFVLDIQKFDVKQTFNTFNTVQKMAPIAENAEGSFSTAMKLVCGLDGKMEPINNTITGGGTLNTHEVKIEGSDALNKMADALKNEKLRTLEMKNVDIKYSFREGRVWVEPFDIEMGGAKANISGSNGFDQTLDYIAKMEVPTSMMGAAGAGAVQGLLSQFNQATGANASIGDKINVDVKITGTANNPKIAPSFPKMGGGAGSAKEDLKKQAKEELDKLKKEAEEKARAEADRLKKEAEDRARQEADKLKKEAEAKARAEADRIKKEAEEKARKEAEAAKKKAEEDLKKKGGDELKKLFGK